MLVGFQERIKSLVDRLGRAAVYRTFASSGPSYDPTLTPTDVAISLVEFDYSAGETDGSVIQRNDVEFVVESSVLIEKQGKIVDGAIEYQIINVDNATPGTESLMYIVQCRR